jgi:hypothetical protein
LQHFPRAGVPQDQSPLPSERYGCGRFATFSECCAPGIDPCVRHRAPLPEAGRDQSSKALNDKLYPMEERLVEFRARAGGDLINYPTRIDSKLARLLDFTSMADASPTEGEKELYGRLS